MKHAANAATLSTEDVHILIHSLTGGRDDRKVYRNHYAASEAKYERLERLVSAGYMERGALLSYGRFYHVTAAGAAAVGLSLEGSF